MIIKLTLLIGQASSTEDKTPGRHEDGQIEKKYTTLTYIAPGVKNILKAEKSCSVFHFTNFERIIETINSGVAERKNSYLSFRKGSHKQIMNMKIKENSQSGKPEIKID